MKKKTIPWGQITALLLTLLFLLSVRPLFFDWYEVKGFSMSPLIQPGDMVLIHKSAFGVILPGQQNPIISWGRPSLDDIVLIQIPGQEPILKRVVGLPGEEVQILHGWIRLRDMTIFLNPEVAKTMAPLKSIPEDQYFVLGENLRFSEDSRSLGLISIENIRGKMLFLKK